MEHFYRAIAMESKGNSSRIAQAGNTCAWTTEMCARAVVVPKFGVQNWQAKHWSFVICDWTAICRATRILFPLEARRKKSSRYVDDVVGRSQSSAERLRESHSGFWLLTSGFSYPAAFWRDIKGRSPLASYLSFFCGFWKLAWSPTALVEDLIKKIVSLPASWAHRSAPVQGKANQQMTNSLGEPILLGAAALSATKSI